MKLPFILFTMFGLSWIASGNDCKDFRQKVRAVISPILGKRKGLHVTLSPDDLANLVGLKHGRFKTSLLTCIFRVEVYIFCLHLKMLGQHYIYT